MLQVDALAVGLSLDLSTLSELQPPVTPAPGDPVLPPGPSGMCSYTHKQKNILLQAILCYILNLEFLSMISTESFNTGNQFEDLFVLFYMGGGCFVCMLVCVACVCSDF